MISRLLYDKGYSQYVEAARIIKSENPSISFKLLGSIDTDYPNHVPYSVLCSDIESGAIEYLGYNKNVKAIIKDVDCIVLPSYYNEGLSRVLMEALAMRKIIITTNIPGCRETVDNNITGFICCPKNIESLVSAIKKVISLSKSERTEMGKLARKKAEEIFDISEVIKTYFSITKQYEIQQP